MELIYNNKKIYYEINNDFETKKKNKPTLVFLHGWGGSTKSFVLAINYFSNLYPVVSMDFWGFGKSDAPNADYCLKHYVEQTRALLEHLNLKNIILIGHSFGGSGYA